MKKSSIVLTLAALAVGLALSGCADPGARPWAHNVSLRNSPSAGLPAIFDPDPDVP